MDLGDHTNLEPAKFDCKERLRELQESEKQEKEQRQPKLTRNLDYSKFQKKIKKNIEKSTKNSIFQRFHEKTNFTHK